MALKVPAAGSHGAKVPSMRVVRLINGVSVRLYRMFAGRGAARAGLLLTTVGARSGQERTVSLAAFPEEGDRWLVVASLGGAAQHPAWLYNVSRNPDRVWAQIGKERFRVRPEILTGEDRAAVWPRIIGRA